MKIKEHAYKEIIWPCYIKKKLYPHTVYAHMFSGVFQIKLTPYPCTQVVKHAVFTTSFSKTLIFNLQCMFDDKLDASFHPQPT